MRRVVLFVAMGALLVSMFPAVALAAEITCGTSSDRNPNSIICEGTDNNDQIRERKGQRQDDIRAKDGDDTINARRAGSDADTVRAQPGDDTVFANDGDTRDTIDCGQGTDTAQIDVKKADSTDPNKITSSDKVSDDCETIKDQNGNTVLLADLPDDNVVNLAEPNVS